MSTRAIQTHYRIGTVQAVTISGTSAPVTNAFGAQTVVVRIVSTTDCYLTFAASPTATSSHSILPAFWPEYFTVTPGQKVALLQVTAGGSASVTEMDQ